jgi:hypothetical protein
MSESPPSEKDALFQVLIGLAEAMVAVDRQLIEIRGALLDLIRGDTDAALKITQEARDSRHAFDTSILDVLSNLKAATEASRARLD